MYTGNYSKLEFLIACAWNLFSKIQYIIKIRYFVLDTFKYKPFLS